MASSTPSPTPHPNSKNPFLNPPVSNNPFLRRISDVNHEAGSGASSSSSGHLAIPSIPPPSVDQAVEPDSLPDSPEQAAPALPERRRSSLPIQSAARVTPTSPAPPPLTHFDTSAYVRSTQEEDLEAAIQASLHEAYAPPPGPPPPPLPTSARPSANRSGTGALNSNPNSFSAQLTPPSDSPARGRLDTSFTSASSSPFPRSRSDSISPPPYTPQPDLRAGEVTMEAGPNRPFQNPSRVPAAGGSGWMPPVGPPSGRPGYPQHRQRSNSNPDLYSPLGGMPSTSRTASAASGRRSGPPGATDGSPSDVPTPGRPLLYDGNVLVYPRGYSCDRCHNTGYKSYDPAHPCSRCWQRYAKAYSGPLMYAPWSNRPSDSNYQQPLPKTRGPLGASRPSNFGSMSRPSGSGGGLLGELIRSGSQMGMGGGGAGRPPPGSVLVKPGDPRIGGRRCWNCGGDGQVSLFLFDLSRCPTCNGMGRIA